MSISHVGLMAVAFTAAAGLIASPAGAAVETQTFDTAASAAAAGWSEVGTRTAPHNYGWSNTNVAGGATGEGGGIIGMNNTSVSSYADRAIGGPFGFTAFSASGRFDLTDIETDPNVRFKVGYFNGSATTSVPESIGFEIQDASSTAFRFTPYVQYSSGLTSTGNTQNVSINGDYTFTMSFDPVNGPFSSDGFPLFRADLFKSDGTTAAGSWVQVVDRAGTVGATPQSITLSAFGINSQLQANTYPGRVEAYIDDLTYTTVPEPTGLAALGAGALLLARRRRA